VFAEVLLACVLLSSPPVDTGEGNERGRFTAVTEQSDALLGTPPLSEPSYRLIVGIANQVRSSVASIVYSADVLHAGALSMPEHRLLATVHDISAASRQLQLTVDGLLDYANLGPAIAVPIALRELLNRVQGLLRSLYRDEAHRLNVVVGAGAEWVRGNPVMVEQQVLDMCLRTAAYADGPRELNVVCAVEGEGSGEREQIIVTTSYRGSSVHSLKLPRSEGPR
jgi:K+-sensing histidine kinase KdpD